MDSLFDSGVPMGFGMALARNERAMQYFSSLTPEKRRSVVEASRAITSKKEMRSYVDSLGKNLMM